MVKFFSICLVVLLLCSCHSRRKEIARIVEEWKIDSDSQRSRNESLSLEAFFYPDQERGKEQIGADHKS